MSFIDTRLSECVAYGFTGGPEWSTLIVDMDNGREQRNGQWLYPKHRYSAQYLNLSPDARDDVLAAFHAARGRLHCFRFKDWNDYTAVAEPLSPSIGTMTPLQLVKTYSLGAQSTARCWRCREAQRGSCVGNAGRHHGTIHACRKLRSRHLYMGWRVRRLGALR